MLNSPHDPLRPLHWRWERAEYLLRAGRYCRKKVDDDYVRAAKRFLYAYDRCSTEAAHERLAEQMPGIYHALRLYRMGEGPDRVVVEARLLTAQPYEDIARRMKTTPEVVFWYEKLFYAVRDELGRRDYVVNRALGDAAHRGRLSEARYDLLLKLYALVGGHLAVDALVEQTSGEVAPPASAADLAAFWHADGLATLRRKAAVAARCLSASQDQHGVLLAAYHKLVEIERQDGRGDDAASRILETVSQVLTGAPFSRHAPGAHAGPAAELRADELLGVAGAPDPAELAGFTFPEPATEPDRATAPEDGSR